MASKVNESQGLKELKKVTKVFKRVTIGLVLVKFSNGNKLYCTPEHPIAVDRKGDIKWIQARNFKKNDKCPPNLTRGRGSHDRNGHKWRKFS